MSTVYYEAKKKGYMKMAAFWDPEDKNLHQDRIEEYASRESAQGAKM